MNSIADWELPNLCPEPNLDMDGWNIPMAENETTLNTFDWANANTTSAGMTFNAAQEEYLQKSSVQTSTIPAPTA